MNAPIALKRGVLFVTTPAGGTLLDVASDRFVSLRPLSAALWSRCVSGSEYEALIAFIETQGFDRAKAERVLRLQLQKWDEAGLVNRDDIGKLPVSRPARCRPSLAFELSQCRLSVMASASLIRAERRYKYLLKNLGLARTLVQLQNDMELKREGDWRMLISRILRSYHFIRRPFRQGATSSDCLLRSLSLAAVLRKEGLAAEVCIGIIEMPFESHAWVEWNGYVLNDSVGRVETYTPIARF